MTSPKESTKDRMEKPSPGSGKPPAHDAQDIRDSKRSDASGQQEGAPKSPPPAEPGEDDYQKAPRDYKSGKQVGNKI